MAAFEVLGRGIYFLFLGKIYLMGAEAAGAGADAGGSAVGAAAAVTDFRGGHGWPAGLHLESISSGSESAGGRDVVGAHEGIQAALLFDRGGHRGVRHHSSFLHKKTKSSHSLITIIKL